jgi:hypothetical protein
MTAECAGMQHPERRKTDWNRLVFVLVPSRNRIPFDTLAQHVRV